MKIYAPVSDTNGVYASVMFRNGVGETDNQSLLHWFKTHGYKLEYPIPEEVTPDIIIEEENDEINSESDEVKIVEVVETEPDFDSMTPYELREWMKENGLGVHVKNIKDKEKLLKLIRG